jgi:dihydrofolate reductase
MGKLFVFNVVTLNGYFEGPNREVDWYNVYAEFNDYAIVMLKSADTLMFGRMTYELMSSYWPTQGANKE